MLKQRKQQFSWPSKTQQFDSAWLSAVYHACVVPVEVLLKIKGPKLLESEPAKEIIRLLWREAASVFVASAVAVNAERQNDERQLWAMVRQGPKEKVFGEKKESVTSLAAFLKIAQKKKVSCPLMMQLHGIMKAYEK